MRKLLLFMHHSLNGYCATKEGGLERIPYTKVFEACAEEILKTVGMPMCGRVTCEMMKGYWPAVLKDPLSNQHEIEHAQWLEQVEKNSGLDDARPARQE